jgi:hypothetical protein
VLGRVRDDPRQPCGILQHVLEEGRGIEGPEGKRGGDFRQRVGELGPLIFGHGLRPLCSDVYPFHGARDKPVPQLPIYSTRTMRQPNALWRTSISEANEDAGVARC